MTLAVVGNFCSEGTLLDILKLGELGKIIGHSQLKKKHRFLLRLVFLDTVCNLVF